jgi:Ca-activated chloride channel family protein
VNDFVSFSDPRWLWLLAALPVLLLLEWRASRLLRRRAEKLVGTRLHGLLLAQASPTERRVGVLLRALAFALLAVGAAGPEWGRELVRRSASGSDVVFVIDVSASMDARDVAPSRLEEARREALAVLDRLQGSRVGVVAFAGDAVRLCPLTLDRSAARLVIESLTSSLVSEPGSDVGRGLRAAAGMLPGRRRAEQAIVLWSDGEDLGEDARPAAEELARRNLRVFAVGVGTPGGDVVPVLDDQGRTIDVKRDENGSPHRSRLDETLLRWIARRSGGTYFTASRPGGELPRLLGALGRVAKSDRGERLIERPVPRFAALALAAALLLAWEIARRHRRRESEWEARAAAPAGAEPIGLETPAPAPAPKSRKGGRRAAAAAFALAGLVLGSSEARAQSPWAHADRAWREGRWADAESLYAMREGRRAPAEVRVNRAAAMARAGKVAEGTAILRDLEALEGRAGQTAAYDHGTLLAEQGQYDPAIESLRRALERDPDDVQARHNYEWALREKKRQSDPRRQPSPQQPQPSPSQPQPQQPQQQPSAQQPQPQGAPQQPEQGPPQRGQRMDRQQAERLLGSLEELERLEQQRLRKVRVMRERRGRDW